MIRADVTAIGTIKRAATIRTDKNNQPYLSFILGITLTDSKGSAKDIELFVMDTKGKQSDISLYSEKKRVSVKGSMNIRTKGEELAYYINAESITTKEVAELDSIDGDLRFVGFLRKDKVCEEKTDRNGKPYLIFSAYSSEKVGDSFVNTWVNFRRFPEKDTGIETVKPEWMQPKAHVIIDGDLHLEYYGGKVRISSRVKDMSLWEKKSRD
ncbi:MULTISPECIES: hypothetical protein [Bacteroidales]|jgi:hypothetical protein|uniref:hypothetical protein n=1 Tax=Bacteroidales TaxID=171549 RepID=UPI0015549328|nr:MULTISPECIES: hypothetical protein [Bacteroidales]NPE37652.1 hypothetical protein [Prevotella sp. PCJ2]